MARKWESVICYESRGQAMCSSRWRLAGVRTKEGAENTDAGVLWLQTTRNANVVTADLYKSADRATGDKVATGTANVAGLDGTAASAVELTLAQANTSGLSGSFFLHAYYAADVCPVQVALCVDEDLDALWDGIESLAGYDATAGCAEFIRLAGEDVLAQVAATFRDRLGGYAASAAWFIEDQARCLPDLRRIANPAQLRLAAAHRALEIAIGRGHNMAAETMYSRLRDYHRAEYDRAMACLVLAFRAGDGGAAGSGPSAAVRQFRV
jgi:hypothetical protein